MIAPRVYIRAHYTLLLAVLTFLGGYAAATFRGRPDLTAWKKTVTAQRDTIQQTRAALVIAQAHTDSTIVQVTHYVDRWHADTAAAWRRDTMHVAGDTTPRFAVPVPTVARWDSSAASCSELAMSCKAERIAAENHAAALEQQLRNYQARPERSCRTAFLIGAAAGAAGDEVVHGRLSIPLLSFHR